MISSSTYPSMNATTRQLVCITQETLNENVEEFPSLSDHLIETGRLDYMALLRTFTNCVQTGASPGYSDSTSFWTHRRVMSNAVNAI